MKKYDDERVLVAINTQTKILLQCILAGCGTAVDLISGNMRLRGGSELPPYSVQYWKMEDNTKPVDKMSTGWQSRN